MYMLTDGSPDYRDTWSFLDRRFDDYENLTQVRVQVQISVAHCLPLLSTSPYLSSLSHLCA